MTVTSAIEPDTLLATEKFAARVRKTHQVKHAFLYGSRARGDHQPDSDVDVAFVLSGPKRRKIDVALEMGELASDILLDDGLFMTPFPIWEDEWADPSIAYNPWLIHAIKREGIAL